MSPGEGEAGNGGAEGDIPDAVEIVGTPEPAAAAETGPAPAKPAEDEILPVIPLRNMVLFPGIITSFSVGRPKSVAAVEEAVRRQSQVAVLAQQDPENEQPSAADLYQVGTAADILRMLVTPDNQRLVLVRGRQRFRAAGFPGTDPFLSVRPRYLSEAVPRTNE